MGYEPVAHGPFAVGVRAFTAHDTARDRVFPAEVRVPAKPGPHPLVLYSHGSGGHRRSATYLTTHLASHGYAVATLDHSELVQPGLSVPEMVAARVPDLRFLLDHLVGDPAYDPDRIGLVGHSFGGWTVLATAVADPRVRAVVAHAPAGATEPLPGVLPLPLPTGPDVPTLFLAAAHDIPIPPDKVRDVHDRTPGAAGLHVLDRADHQHFVDDVEGMHESARTMAFPPEGAWIPAAMRPMAELVPGVVAHAVVRGLTLAHLDAVLRDNAEAAAYRE